jgi:hypothetical protein
MKITIARIAGLTMVLAFTSGVWMNGLSSLSSSSAKLNGVVSAQNRFTVPAGTRILIRTSDTLNSARQNAGARFAGTLETNLTADGVVVAPRGTIVHGQLAGANSAGRMAGSSSLVLELTDIMINGTLFPVITNTYQVEGRGSGGQTARGIARGAGLGTAIGAVAGGGRGAGIGAVSGAALGTARAAGTEGQQVSVDRGTLLEFRLQQPVTLPRAS